jgi:murein tripeptide amidase MpaA
MRTLGIPLAAIALVAGCARHPSANLKSASLPRTRAERTNYAETSHYADVLAFLDSLQRAGVPMARSVLGTTTEGRALPLVVMSRPLVESPRAARALGRPIVYVQANIHAGEVEGKEALLALLRDLGTAPGRDVLDSIVLVAVPIYNADGNEKFAPQAVNRTEQNGPELVGQRPNGQGLDLNRDYVKAEAPETRASLAAFDAWDPDVFVDLHTTDGSFHGYALTYAPSLNPAAMFGGTWARDSLLPELRRRMRARDGFETFDYGNFDAVYEERDLTDTVKSGWYSYDHRPRFGTNYYGLRGRVAVLSEAYSHDPFERRVKATYAFVRELLSLAAERSASLRRLRAAADSSVVAWAGAGAKSPEIPIRAELTKQPVMEDVTYEDLVRTGDSSLTQPGVPRGLRRTGHFRTRRMPVYVTFTPTLSRALPAGWALPSSDTAAVRLLRLHGVRVDSLAAGATATAERFVIDSTDVAARSFQGHHERRVSGRWDAPRGVSLPAGAWIIRAAQPQGIAALYLLDPESDDGLVTWNVFDAELHPRGVFPALRLTELPR